MSRKDYVAIAEAIVTAVADKETRTALVRELVPVFKKDNSAFSADRFAVACEVLPEPYYGY